MSTSLFGSAEPEAAASGFPRRKFLVGSAAGAAAAVLSLPTHNAWANPVTGYAELRDRYRALLIGSSIDPSVPVMAKGIADLNIRVADLRAKIVAGADRDRVFSDIVFDPALPGGASNTYNRLLLGAQAYCTPGAVGHQDAALLLEILDGLRTTHDHMFRTGQPEAGNWYYWEIAGPLALGGVLVLLWDKVPAADRADYVAAMDWFVGDPGLQFERYPGRTPLESLGSNRVDLCLNTYLIGMISESQVHMDLAGDRMGAAFLYGPEAQTADFYSGQGLYPDGSFIGQGRVAYNGAYGVDHMAGIGRVLGLLGGSPWVITDPRVGRILDAVDQAYVPIVFDGQVMDGVRGRSIARVGTIGFSYGTTLTEAILRLANAADPETAARWRRICRGWLQRNTTTDVFAGALLSRISLFTELLDDMSIGTGEETPGFQVFPTMARAILRGTGWGCMITAASDRVSMYDYQNSENYDGFHTYAGAVQVYASNDNSQFADEFWPTVNLYGLAGTTVDTQALPPGAGGGSAGKTLAANAWAGGVALDDQYGSFGQDLRGCNSTMTARQAWFCLPNRLVALGANITGGSGQPIITTIEHRNLHADGTNALTVDGTEQPNAIGWEGEFSGTSWAHVDGVGGYVLLQGQRPLRASRTRRTGAWSDINDGAATSHEPISRRYVTLWLDHGRPRIPYSTVVDIHSGAEAFEQHGAWREGTTVVGVNGGSTLAIPPQEAGQAWCIWRPVVPATGRYEVSVWFPAFRNNPPSAPYTVTHSAGTDTVVLNQKINAGSWQTLGEYEFATGRAEVRMDVDGSGFPKADAVRLTEVVSGSLGPDSGYAYLQLPQASVASTAAAAADPKVVILRNSADVQAIEADEGAVAMANFFVAGEVRRIRADGPCAVAARFGHGVTVAAADPTAKRDQIVLKVKTGGFTRRSSGDDTVGLERDGATMIITIDTSDRDGRTHRVQLSR